MSELLAVEPEVADLDVLAQVERQVLWLATAMVDHANRVRPNPSGIKVGGHQASSASMVSIATALWFHHLRAEDRVAVKPHASPVLHAISFLLGHLDEHQLTTLRQFGGLQSYPSRTKDSVPPDFSTGSVGIGATAPIWAALSRRYLDAHAELAPDGRRGRQYSLVGDAELDEGACWEAVFDPMVAELGEVVWVVDYNRQSLDRVVPTIGAGRLEAIFAAAGWQVITVKWGATLLGLFERPGGPALRERLEQMSNPEYQRLLRHGAGRLRELLPGSGPMAQTIAELLAGVSDELLLAAIRNLGGHDLAALSRAFDEIEDHRPTVIMAYTIKGYGLPTEGHPQNHSALLSAAQMEKLATSVGADLTDPWQRFEPGTPPERICQAAAQRLVREPMGATGPRVDVPLELGRTPTGVATTQAALSRTLIDLSRHSPQVGARIVTVSPDVSSSTNLAGWVNRVGIFATSEHHDWFADDADTVLHWRERPSGQHVELGIAETNLVGLLGELGATWSRWGQPLLPIGVMYDPFVGRALEPWSFGIYAGGQSILIGTPSGVTLAAEGGAHQSIVTPSIGIEQPGCTAWEPAFALDAQWCLLAALSRLGRPDGESAYLRLSTRPVDQSLAAVPADPVARERRRQQVVAGGYRLQRVAQPAVTIAAMGAMVTEALQAADRLSALGYQADVVCITSADQLFRAHQARRGLGSAPTWLLESLFPGGRATPLVTVVDGHPHTLSFLNGWAGGQATNLGVSSFGQSGDLQSVYRYHGIDSDAIVGAALDLVD